MKKLKFIDKILFFINSVVAFALLLSFILPFVAPKTFSFLSVLSLAVPFLIILNILFVVYWLLKVKKQLLVSLLILVIGYTYLGALYKFSSSKSEENTKGLTVMNYNVRLFNLYDWIPEKNIESSIVNLIKTEQPDILSIQEYHPHKNVDLSSFKYKFEKLEGKKIKYGQAIFSQYPIINSGSIEFPNTANNAIFVDILKGNDTIRIYNIHLQSLGVDTNIESLKKENSERLFKRISKTFVMQQNQAELFLKHKANCKYKMIVCGDFNNTAYSYVYRQIKGDLQDAFEDAGNGFGRTFNFKFFPVRIDFILADESFNINSFKTLDEELSDHYPIISRISLKE